MISKRLIQLGIRFLLSGIFACAAIGKLLALGHAQTPRTIYAQWSHSASTQYLNSLGEMTLALWLLSGKAPQISAVVAIVILSTYSGLIVVELTKDRPLPCGCTGSAPSSVQDLNSIRASLSLDLARNIVMMAGATVLYLEFSTTKKRPAAPVAQFNVSDISTALLRRRDRIPLLPLIRHRHV